MDTSKKTGYAAVQLVIIAASVAVFGAVLLHFVG